VKITIKTKNIKLGRALKDFIEGKINDLEKFLPIFRKKYYNGFWGKGKPRVEAWVEVEKTTLHHRKGPIVFRAECQMRLPGKSLRSEALSEDLRLAICQVKDELQCQLKQYKNKKSARSKRGQGEFKRSLRLASSAQFSRQNFAK